MVRLFFSMCAAAYLCSGAGSGGGIVGNQTDWQLGGLFPWSYRLRIGTDDHVFLIFTDCASYFEREEGEKAACVVKAADGAAARLDSWRAVDRSACVR